MKLNKLLKTLVEVEWEDPVGGGGWIAPEEVDKITPAECRTWGLLISVDKKYLRTASAMNSTHDGACVGDVTCIPRSLVRKVTPLDKL